MRRLLAATVTAGLLLALPACNPFAPAGGDKQATQNTPAIEAVSSVYRTYENAIPTPTGPVADWSSLRSKALAGLYLALPAAQEASDDPILDFDPIVGAQDWEIRDLTFQETPSTDPAKRAVTASFKNFDNRHSVTFDMVLEEGAWKVDNIRATEPNAYDVRAIFTAAGVQ